MAKNAWNDPSGRKRQWFARRQVYLRTAEDSQYVELSPLLQIGTAIGFGALALWLIGASYGAVTGYLKPSDNAGLTEELSSTQEALAEAERERDDALQEIAKVSELETALANAEKSNAEAPSLEDMTTLTTELEQTKDQLEELQLRLSEEKANTATLQARFEAETIGANAEAIEKSAEEAANLHAQLEEAFVEIEALEQQRDETSLELSSLRDQESLKTEEINESKALLEAAEAEIERLQTSVENAESTATVDRESYEATIVSLEQERDKIATELNDSRDRAVSETTERYEALMKTAQAEIERLQTSLELAGSDADQKEKAYQETAGKLQQDLDDSLASTAALEETVARLNGELEQLESANDVKTTRDAEDHVQSIEALSLIHI